jgi:hypothetical protein
MRIVLAQPHFPEATAPEKSDEAVAVVNLVCGK